MKILVASMSSLLLLMALGLILSGLNFFGSFGNGNSFDLWAALFLVFLACYCLSWVNTKSLKRAFLGGLGGLLIGLPLGFILLVPFGNLINNFLFPLSNLGLSGSLSFAWIELGIVTIIEILTDRVLVNKRWVFLLASLFVVMIMIYIIELFTARYGITNNSSVIKTMFYTPFIWGFVVGMVNVRSVQLQEKVTNGTKVR